MAFRAVRVLRSSAAAQGGTWEQLQSWAITASGYRKYGKKPALRKGFFFDSIAGCTP